jgi:hypothetical protein
VVILIAVAASSLYLERKRLFTLADGAALVGAEEFALSDVTVDPTGPHVHLTSAGVVRAVDEYVDDNPVDGLDALRIERAGTLDGMSATVSLSAYWRPPILTVLLPEGIRVEVTSTARSAFS